MFKLTSIYSISWLLLILLLSVASIKKKLLKTNHTEERIIHSNSESCNFRLGSFKNQFNKISARKNMFCKERETAVNIIDLLGIEYRCPILVWRVFAGFGWYFALWICIFLQLSAQYCMDNMEPFILGHNRKIIREEREKSTISEKMKECNCRVGVTRCPLKGKFLTQSIIYKSIISTNDET